MKTKRFLSLLLALVMSLSMAVPAFAADGPDDPDAGIMPLAQLYNDDYISAESGYYRPSFTTTPGAGKYLRVWFRNKGTEPVVVTLLDSTNKYLTSKTFNPGTSEETFLYIIPTPNKACTFYLTFESNGPSGEQITGQAAAAQYTYNPGN